MLEKTFSQSINVFDFVKENAEILGNTFFELTELKREAEKNWLSQTSSLKQEN